MPTGPENPYGLSLGQRNAPLTHREGGKAGHELRTQRAWEVVNNNVINGLGTHPAYKLVPGGAFPAMFDPNSPVVQSTGHRPHAVGDPERCG